MGPDILMNLLQDMLRLCTILILPPLGVALIVGLTVGLIQAITSIQEQTLAFVPKILAVVLILIFAGNYMLRLLIDYSIDLFAALPAYGAM
ncbi:MAG: flagellar biosynthetic protein FliQ [Planctomycetota bacterium]|nr:MAG: flagellar biosynthetic protein FliQ [Planctomycetota bacterium]